MGLKRFIPLNNVTLPPSDPFWAEYYPPNGWQCRCTAVQVLKSKYKESNPKEAMAWGNESTKGPNKIFRFNPGTQKVIFPPHHPYFKDKEAVDAMKSMAREERDITTPEELSEVLGEVSKDKGWFERGYKGMFISNQPGLNGYTYMEGDVYLSPEIMNNSISAVNKLRKGIAVTRDEAKSIATFWHEITHNRNKFGNMPLNADQRLFMELANEFVARNTMHEFYGAFGSAVQHPEFITHRDNTIYNRMVRNYQYLIEKTRLDKQEVLERVKEHLFNRGYSIQKVGLSNALKGAKKTDGTKLKKAEIISLVKRCKEYSEESFRESLDGFIR